MFSATRTHAPSFEEYAAAAWSMLYRSAYLLAGNHADAEDLAQQTLIKAHASWAKVSASDSANAYVRRILTNTFLSSKRPKARRLELLADEMPEWGRATGMAGARRGCRGRPTSGWRYGRTSSSCRRSSARSSCCATSRT